MLSLLRKIFYTTVLVFGMTPTATYGQDYNFDNYTVEDGLALNQVLSVFQDSKGYIYLGTNQAGFSVFDGNKFVTYKTRDGLVDNVVYSFFEDDDGKIYIGTNGGLSVFDGLNFENYTTKDGLNHNRIFNVMIDKNHNVWLSTMQGLCLFNDGKITPFEHDSVLATTPVFCSFEDSQGNLFWGTIFKGAAKWNQKEVVYYSTKDGLGHNFVRTIGEDRDRNIWIGTAKGFSVLDKDAMISPRRTGNMESLTATSCLLSRDGEMWFATESGIYVWEGTELKLMLKEENGLPSSQLMGICEDDEGNIWFGSGGKGAIKFNYHSNVFVNFSEEGQEIYDDQVDLIYQDRKNRIWFGAPEGLTSSVPKNKSGSGPARIFKQYSYLADNLPIGYGQKSVAAVEDSTGRLWFGTRMAKGGLWYFDEENEKLIEYDNPAYNKLLNKAVNNIVINKKDESMWVSLTKGLFRVSGDSMSFPFANDITENVWCTFFDSKGGIWIATENGAAHYGQGTIQYFTKKDGFVDGRVRKIIEDKYENIWFCTNEGIMIYDGKQFKQLSEEDGIADNTIYSLIEDKDQNIWYGSPRGIGKILVEDLHEKGKLVHTYFGKEEGFSGVECNNNAAMLGNDGKLWFGTVKGATVFDPALYHKNETEPRTYITNLRLNFSEFDWTSYCDSIDLDSRLPLNLVVPYNRNHITFDFVGISHTSPTKVRYQWKLDPIDENWLPVTEKNEAVYPHIPPGEYTFMVKAMNGDGVWNENPLTYNFAVLPPWYQTWWFYTLVVLMIGSGFYAFIVIRTNQLKRQKIILEDKVRLRTAELRKEKEKVEQVNMEVLEKNHIIEEKNKDIFDSINYAKRIQEALLPSEKRIRDSFHNLFVYYSPKDIVSGDFYWFGRNGNRAYLAAVDCTGHGVPGAFMSMIGHNLLNQVVLRQGVEQPGEVMKFMNNNLKSALQSEGMQQANDGMDMCLVCLYDEKDGKQYLEYAGANNPLWIVKDGALEEIKASKYPIGGVTERDFVYETHRYEIEKGVTYYICSDGYQDQFGGPKGKKFMKKKMKQMLVEINGKELVVQRDLLRDTLVDWMGQEHEQVDDVLCIGIKF